MATNSSHLSRFLGETAGQAQFAALVLAGALAFPSLAAAADPSKVAVVESISGNSSGVEFMDYLHLGQVIRLNNRETLVLSYNSTGAKCNPARFRDSSGGAARASPSSRARRVSPAEPFAGAFHTNHVGVSAYRSDRVRPD